MDRSAGKTYLSYGAKLGLTKDQAPDIFSDLRSIGFSVIEGSGQDYYVTSGGTVRRLRKGSQYLDGDKVVKGYEKEGVDRKTSVVKDVLTINRLKPQGYQLQRCIRNRSQHLGVSSITSSRSHIIRHLGKRLRKRTRNQA